MPEVGVSVPQAPEGLPEVVRVTESPDTGLPDESLTVTVTVEVEVPLAGTEDGLAATVTWLGPCCVTVVVPDPPLLASVAVMVQEPAVLDAV